MLDDITKSEPSQPGSGDVATKPTQEQTQEKTEKVEVSQEELTALKADKQKTQGELDALKATVYSEGYVNYLQSKQTPKTEAPQENLEFLSQKELINLVRKERQQDMANLRMGIASERQEVTTTGQIKQAQKDHADFEARRPALRKIAERIGGGLSAEDAYRLDWYDQHKAEITKTSPPPRATLKPGTSSGVVKKTEFSDNEALEEAARQVGLEEALAKTEK